LVAKREQLLGPFDLGNDQASHTNEVIQAQSYTWDNVHEIHYVTFYIDRFLVREAHYSFYIINSTHVLQNPYNWAM